MDNLARFDSDEIEIFVNEKTGESFASLRALARMTGKAASTIQRFTVLRNFELHNTQADTAGGIQAVSLLNEDQIIEVLEQYNTDRLKQFAKIGIRTALHQIAGYQNISVATSAKPKSLLDLSPTKLYRLAAHQLLIEFGKKPDPELAEGIDLEYFKATGDAAFYAYHRTSSEIAKGTKLANDALRDVGWLEDSEKEKKKEDQDVKEFAKYVSDLDKQFAGAKDFYQFESNQLSLAGGQ